MRLYLVRHAIAEPRSETVSEEDRALTETGRLKMQRAAKGLDRIKLKIEIVLSSPLRRALETAEILASGLGGVSVETIPELAPGFTPESIVPPLTHYRDRKSVAMVGHEPDLSRFASHLLTGSADSCALEFKKGAIACLDVEFGPDAQSSTRSVLKWLMPPRLMRAL